MKTILTGHSTMHYFGGSCSGSKKVRLMQSDIQITSYTATETTVAQLKGMKTKTQQMSLTSVSQGTSLSLVNQCVAIMVPGEEMVQLKAHN